MKKHDFVYIFYGLKIILSAFVIIAFIFGIVWLFLHYQRFAFGFMIVAGIAVLIGFAWVIGQNKYWDEEKVKK
jgi:uncharacterized membrane protein YqjE